MKNKTLSIMAALLALALTLGGARGAYNPSALSGPYSCCYSLTTSFGTSSAASAVVLSGWTKVFDTSATPFYSAGAPTRFTIPATGRYLVIEVIDYTGGATTAQMHAQIYKNGALYVLQKGWWKNNTANHTDVMNIEVLSLAAGDYLEAYGFQNTATTWTITGAAGMGAYTSYVCIAFLPGQ